MLDATIWRLPPPISGGSDADLTPDPGLADPPSDTPEPSLEPEPAADPTAPKAPESFINPSDLPEEIKPHWTRMHRAYTKALEKFNGRKADHDLLDNFRGNESFALDLLRAEAQRRGLQLAPVNGTTTPAAAPAPTRSADGPPARVVEAIRARLDPSLQWMADSLAAGQWEAAQESMKPIVERDRAKETASREQEFSGLAAKLSESAPGWEAHEDDMNALLDWIRSPQMTHSQFGDKLTFLYNAVTGGSVAKRAAIDAMASAGRNASRTGLSARPMTSNVHDRVRQATSTQDAFKIAREEAERELRAAGVALPN